MSLRLIFLIIGYTITHSLFSAFTKHIIHEIEWFDPYYAHTKGPSQCYAILCFGITYFNITIFGAHPHLNVIKTYHFINILLYINNILYIDNLKYQPISQ